MQKVTVSLEDRHLALLEERQKDGEVGYKPAAGSQQIVAVAVTGTKIHTGSGYADRLNQVSSPLTATKQNGCWFNNQTGVKIYSEI